jgi:hypothetical protein
VKPSESLKRALKKIKDSGVKEMPVEQVVAILSAIVDAVEDMEELLELFCEQGENMSISN